MKYRIISGTDFVAVIFEGSTPLQIDGMEAQIYRMLAEENIEKDEERKVTPLQSAVSSAPIEPPPEEDYFGFKRHVPKIE